MSSSPRMKLDLGAHRGYFAFTAKELRRLVILVATLVSCGVSYVIRCEIKFVVLEKQLAQCQDSLKPLPVVAIQEKGKP